MNKSYRIGMRILPSDPFWVQVREAAMQRAQQRGIVPVPLTFAMHETNGAATVDLLDEFRAQELDALICNRLPRNMSLYFLNAGLPVIYTEESDLRHPRLISPSSLYTAAQMAGAYLIDNASSNVAQEGRNHARRQRCLMISVDEDWLPTAIKRVQGFTAIMQTPAAMAAKLDVTTVKTSWLYTEACATLRAHLTGANPPFDPGQPLAAIFGLSDPLALAALDVGRELGFVDEQTRVAGINGDPLALAAIVDGRMHATVETGAVDLAHNLIDYACRAAQGARLPATFPYKLRLVTAENVAQVSAEKLVAIAELPSRLVDINQRQEQDRLRHWETSLAMNQRVNEALDGAIGLHDLADLIRSSYGYDSVQLFMWDSSQHALKLNSSATDSASAKAVPLAESGLLGQALLQNQAIFIPDSQRSQRFAPDPAWPTTSTRLALPIRQSRRVAGVLDLHSRRRMLPNQAELDALQSLADQLGGIIQNRRLYTDALAAKSVAEQASLLKTRLLANVSHELRTPLNVILGYSAVALEEPSPYGAPLPPLLRKDLRHITESSEHLVRLINDLLDLSLAESGTLAVYPVRIETHTFLTNIFEGVATGLTATSEGATPESTAGKRPVQWQLQLPAALPSIMADPVRLRQILLNLLSNAAKFTQQGRIALGAGVMSDDGRAADQLHIWVEDTGRGIPPDMLAQIFEAFVSAEATSSSLDRTHEGVGLGLSVTHELVRLHGGAIKIDSLLGYGTTCHLYWPIAANGESDATIRPALRVQEPSDEPLAELLAELVANSSALVQRTTDYIHANHTEEMSRTALAAALDVSPNYVTRVFRKETGLTPWQYLNRYRIAQAQRALRSSDASITEIAAKVGFNDPAYFSRVFRRECGQSPGRFRNQTK